MRDKRPKGRQCQNQNTKARSITASHKQSEAQRSIMQTKPTIHERTVNQRQESQEGQPPSGIPQRNRNPLSSCKQSWGQTNHEPGVKGQCKNQFQGLQGVPQQQRKSRNGSTDACLVAKIRTGKIIEHGSHKRFG
jgi:hypothetical protein